MFLFRFQALQKKSPKENKMNGNVQATKKARRSVAWKQYKNKKSVEKWINFFYYDFQLNLK